MKKKILLLVGLLLVVSCVTSTAVNNKSKAQDDKALQKQALKERIQSRMAAQNRVIDSLIQVKDPRLKKDKDGNFIRPNSISPSGKPIYYETYHGRSHRKAIKADVVGTGSRTGYNLNGAGIHMGIWDDGHVFAAHDEFTGGPDYFGPSLSIEISDASTANVSSSHPTSVTSIMVAKGLFHQDNYDITGIAPGVAKIYS